MSSNAEMIRKRRVPRKDFFRSVGLLVDGHYDMVRAYEIAELGMLISTSKKLKVGARLVLSFYLPGADFAIVRAAVRYLHEGVSKESGESSYGLEFEGAGFEMKRKIRFYVASTQKANG